LNSQFFHAPAPDASTVRISLAPHNDSGEVQRWQQLKERYHVRGNAAALS